MVCQEATPDALDALTTLATTANGARLAVYSPRPNALALLLAERGIDANTYAITDALLKGQVRHQPTTAL